MHPEQGHREHEAGPEGEAGVDDPKAPALVAAPPRARPTMLPSAAATANPIGFTAAPAPAPSSVSRGVEAGIVEHPVEQRAPASRRRADRECRAPAGRDPLTARSPRASGSRRSRIAPHGTAHGGRRRASRHAEGDEIVRGPAHRGEPAPHRELACPPAPPVRAPSPAPVPFSALELRSRRSTVRIAREQRGDQHRIRAGAASAPARADPSADRRQLGHPAAAAPDSCQSRTSVRMSLAVRTPLNHSSRTRSAESRASPRRRLDGGGPGRRIDREIEPGGEPQPSQNAQGKFFVHRLEQ